jgi:hypothetical protein
MLTVHRLTKYYGALAAIQNLAFEVRPGEFQGRSQEMRNQFLAIGLISAVLTSAAPAAQTKPDFSGTWTFDDSRSPYFATSNPRVSVPAQPVLGEAFTVTQDDKLLTITRAESKGVKPTIVVDGIPQPDGPLPKTVSVTTVFALGGSPSHNRVPSIPPGEPDVDTLAIVLWEGDKLVIAIESQGSHLTRSLQLQSDGALLVQQTSGTPGGAQTTVKSFYRKKT